MTDTETRVQKIIIDHLGVDPTKASRPEARMVEDLGADSFDTIEIVMAAEDEFKIKIADDDADQVSTVGELVALIDVFLAQPATAA